MNRRLNYSLVLACFGAGVASGALAQTPDQRSETECKQLWLVDTQPPNWDRYYECTGHSTANVPEADPGGTGVYTKQDPLLEPPATTARQPDDRVGG